MAVSEKQLTFITSLIERREAMFRNAGQSEQADAIAEMKVAVLAQAQGPTMNARDGSKAIDRLKTGNDRIGSELKSAIEARRAAERSAAPKKEELEDGFYQLDDTIYKVIHNKTETRQYAKELQTTKYDNGDGTFDVEREFVFVPGAISKLKPEHKMTIEQAEEYGKLYERCVNCGRKLRAEESVKRAMGPVCAGKFG